MTGEQSSQGTEQYVPVNALEGLMEGWHHKVSDHEFDGTPEEYRAAMEAHEDCRDDVQTVIENLAKEADDL